MILKLNALIDGKLKPTLIALAAINLVIPNEQNKIFIYVDNLAVPIVADITLENYMKHIDQFLQANWIGILDLSK